MSNSPLSDMSKDDVTLNNEEVRQKETVLRDCYLCLEPTVGRSPCECGAPIHTSCLLELVEKNPVMQCSICKKPLHGFYLSETAHRIDVAIQDIENLDRRDVDYVTLSSQDSCEERSRCIIIVIRICLLIVSVIVISYVLAVCNPTACANIHPSSLFVVVVFMMIFLSVMCFPCDGSRRRRFSLRPPTE